MPNTKYPVLMDDSWFTVSTLDPTTFAISEFGHWEKVHSYLLLGQQCSVLIDTGLGIDNIKRITDQLTNLPIKVITTHVHVDHIGSHGQFEEIYVHEAEEDLLINGIPKLSIEQIRKDISRDITKPVPVSFNPTTYTPYQGIPTGVLRDEDVIDIGARSLKIFHTPGHSPGHIAIYDINRGYLFTGDLLYSDTPVYAFYPTTSPEDLVDSWQKIAKIEGVKQIFGAHNEIGLEPELLNVVKEAVFELRKKNLIHFGTGIHQFNGFSVRF
ncbi:MBL fold metallo-hydrolase [Paenibacillus wenxiniae]|uniref:MBL fold metallo-hydrolase n=1 Tax=Paenibacillus wenxiniae TaxID=1636843 RepID=A0ABW4RNY1_9BACL